jgi:hypothetical protein
LETIKRVLVIFCISEPQFLFILFRFLVWVSSYKVEAWSTLILSEHIYFVSQQQLVSYNNRYKNSFMIEATIMVDWISKPPYCLLFGASIFISPGIPHTDISANVGLDIAFLWHNVLTAFHHKFYLWSCFAILSDLPSNGKLQGRVHFNPSNQIPNSCHLALIYW